MKKSITTLFLLFNFTLSYAQQKPTKEETFKYIKNELEGKQFNINSNSKNKNNGTYTKEEAINTYSEMRLESCKIEFIDDYKVLITSRGFKSSPDSYREIIHESKNNKSIDLSQIESIGFGTADLIDFEDNIEVPSGRKLVAFNFNQKKKNDSKNEEPISIYIGEFNDDFEDYKSLKIYKAFQHLRKLCNAPEPISFD